MSNLLLPLIVGLSQATLLFLVASGLTLTLGVMRILNMAHGGFFMVGAFVMYSLVQLIGGDSIGFFLLEVVCAVIAVSVLGVILERVVYRRTYSASTHGALFGIFSLLLLFNGAVEQIWGVDPLSITLPAILDGSVPVLGVAVPRYNILLTVVGLIVLPAIWLLLGRTRLGLEARAVAMDRDMASVLGLRTRAIFLKTFVLGCALAALGGALIAPKVSLTVDLGSNYLILAFAVVLVGGLGSISGAALASLILGLLDSFVSFQWPPLAGYTVYIAMVLILCIRPRGLFGTSAEVEM